MTSRIALAAAFLRAVAALVALALMIGWYP